MKPCQARADPMSGPDEEPKGEALKAVYRNGREIKKTPDRYFPSGVSTFSTLSLLFYHDFPNGVAVTVAYPYQVGARPGQRDFDAVADMLVTIH